MNILFIRPAPPHETIGLQHVMVVEPLELEVMATLVMERHQTAIVDLILEKKPIGHWLEVHKPDMVCITGYIAHVNIIKRLCQDVKSYNKHIITVVGGVHVELNPQDLDDDAVDYRIVRNATRTFPALVEAIATGAGIPPNCLRKGEIPNPENTDPIDFYFPIPDRRLTEKYRNRYFYVFHDKVALIKTSFGCPFQCSFCYCRMITGGRYAERDLDEVIRELKGIREKEIYIVDDDFLISEQRVSDFLDRLEQESIIRRFLIYGRADFIAAHPELMQRFRRLGLRTVIVGLESFFDKELEEFQKKTSAQVNTEAMAVLNRFGIDCYAALIVSPEWSKEDFRFVTGKLIDLKIKFLNIQPLTPLSPTELDADEGQLLVSRNEFERWDLAHVILRPQKMTLGEYYREILRMYEKVMFRPLNMIHHLKYPLYMQWRLFRGTMKVHRQYRTKIMETE